MRAQKHTETQKLTTHAANPPINIPFGSGDGLYTTDITKKWYCIGDLPAGNRLHKYGLNVQSLFSMGKSTCSMVIFNNYQYVSFTRGYIPHSDTSHRVCRQRKDGLGLFCPSIAGRLVTAGSHLWPGSGLFPSSGSSAALAGSMSLDFWMWKLCASVPVSRLYGSGMFWDVLGKLDHDHYDLGIMLKIMAGNQPLLWPSFRL